MVVNPHTIRALPPPAGPPMRIRPKDGRVFARFVATTAGRQTPVWLPLHGGGRPVETLTDRDVRGWGHFRVEMSDSKTRRARRPA
jgi:hypothetical protein